jgi:hypothetical protein
LKTSFSLFVIIFIFPLISKEISNDLTRDNMSFTVTTLKLLNLQKIANLLPFSKRNEQISFEM